ncbi:MAG TPA: DUF5666 domain-containing protein [Planctomycetota bacterium]|nr:DUF5666 domain-containing protein [Planctomycetota bacterium]
MFFKPLSRSLIGLSLAALLLTGCGSGGGGGSSGGGVAAGSTDFLITDATVDELLAFQTTIQGIRLVSSAGVPSSNLLVAPLAIDLIGAGVSPRWVSREDLPEGLFRGVAIELAPASSSAIDRNGAAVPVTQVGTSFELAFASPKTITSGGYRQILLDIDLSLSLTGTPTAPPISFDPRGTAALASGGASSSVIDEVKGVVQTTDAGNNSFIIDAFADGDLSLPLGKTTVAITGATLLLDENGSSFASANSFFNALVAGTTLLEVHGSLIGGQITATRVEVEDDGFGGSSYVVKIDGRVSNLDKLANTFTLQIIEIEKGSSIATQVINGQSSVPVTYTVSTSFVLEEHIPTSEASLSEGQRVKVKFPAFVNSPFPASQIEIEDQPEFEGRITSVAGFPNTITMRLDSDEPAIASGQVQSSSTSVMVDISASSLFLDTHANPSLSTSQLQVGLKLEVHGAISGPANAPTITASKTKIHAGRFKGHAVAVFPALHSFNATMSDLKDSFGNSVSFGAAAVNFDPAARFEDEASSESQFYALFNGMNGGDSLEVEVLGLGTITTPNEILCYEIKSKVD